MYHKLFYIVQKVGITVRYSFMFYSNIAIHPVISTGCFNYVHYFTCDRVMLCMSLNMQN